MNRPLRKQMLTTSPMELYPRSSLLDQAVEKGSLLFALGNHKKQATSLIIGLAKTAQPPFLGQESFLIFKKCLAKKRLSTSCSLV